MGVPLQQPDDRLKAAWAKFNERVRAIRTRTKDLLLQVDERKRAKEMEELRKKIGQS